MSLSIIENIIEQNMEGNAATNFEDQSENKTHPTTQHIEENGSVENGIDNVNINIANITAKTNIDLKNQAETEKKAGGTLNNNKQSETCKDKPENAENTLFVDSPGPIIVGSPEVLINDVSKLQISTEESKATEIKSKVVVNSQNESLKSLMAYDGDSDSEQSDTETQAEVCDISSEDDENKTNTKNTWRNKIDNASDSSDSEDDSSASTLSSDSESDNIENLDGDSASVIEPTENSARPVQENCDKGAVKRRNPNIADMEEFLPPLPDLSKLKISIDNADFMHIGKVSAIISELVTIEAIPGTPAFDLDSMLFIDDEKSKKPIGPVFDVLGPVTEPIYCVRFNDEQEVKDLGLEKGVKVYCVPKNQEFTKFVFVQELLKMKGSDASWLNDQETPDDVAEFSDDEKEREAKRAKKTSSKRKLDDGSLERHKRYEKTMNQCNTLNTRVCKLMDAHTTLSRQIRPKRTETDQDQSSVSLEEIASLPSIPHFDPTVPPPGFGSFAGAATPPSFGQSPTFRGSPYGTYSVSPLAATAAGSPIMFGGHHFGGGNEGGRQWYQRTSGSFRRPPRPNNSSRQNQENSGNSFTNNGRNSRGAGAGPSSQLF